MARLAITGWAGARHDSGFVCVLGGAGLSTGFANEV